ISETVSFIREARRVDRLRSLVMGGILPSRSRHRSASRSVPRSLRRLRPPYALQNAVHASGAVSLKTAIASIVVWNRFAERSADYHIIVHAMAEPVIDKPYCVVTVWVAITPCTPLAPESTPSSALISDDSMLLATPVWKSTTWRPSIS